MRLMETDNLKSNSLYRIAVLGDLDDSWADWLGELSSERIYQELSSGQTVIICDVPDQAALRGLMNRIWDLNLTIVSVKFEKYVSNGGTNGI